MRIRRLQATDRLAIEKILCDSGNFRPEEIEVGMELVDTCIKEPNNPDYQVMVVENGTRTVTGFTCFGPRSLARGVFDLYWIAVSPNHRRHGFGSALLAAAEEQIATKSGRMILVETSDLPSYKDARRFYKSNGYKAVASIPDFYGPGDALIVTQKLLHDY